MAGRACFARGVPSIHGAHTKKPPLKGKVPAKRAEGFPGAGEDSMRRAGPRTPLMQAACVGGASQGRPGRGSLRFRTNGPVENVPFSTRACA